MMKDPHERVIIRTAAKDHRCWTTANHFNSDDEVPCAGTIYKGDRYVLSTIYPGHDSGYADAGWKDGTLTPPRPVSSRFCLPCGQRWTNLRDALAEMDA